MSPTPKQQMTVADRLADDVLIGAAAIAEELGVNRKTVYRLAQAKRLPIGKLGKQLIARRSALRRAFDKFLTL